MVPVKTVGESVVGYAQLGDLTFDYEEVAKDLSHYARLSDLDRSMVRAQVSVEMANEIVAGIKESLSTQKGRGEFVGGLAMGASGGILKRLSKAPTSAVPAYIGGENYFLKVGPRKLHLAEGLQKLKPTVRDQLKGLEFPEKPLIEGGGLLGHEIRGGHTLEKHVAQTKEQLVKRIEAENRDVVSSFRNPKEAEQCVSRIMQENKKAIADWLEEKPKKPLKLEYEFDHSVGYSIARDTMMEHDISGVSVYLKRSANTPEKYIVRTAFPIKLK